MILLAEKGKRSAPKNRSVRDFIDVEDWVDWDWVDGLPDVIEEQRIKPTKGGKAVYPTQKPLSLLRTLIQQSSNEGDLVCDPFAGSGSTLVAAALEGRDYLGFDLAGPFGEKAKAFCAARDEWFDVPGSAKRPEAIVQGRSESDILGLFGN